MAETMRTREKELINWIRSGLVDPNSRGTVVSESFTATNGQTDFPLTNTRVKYVTSVKVNGVDKYIGYHYSLVLGEGTEKSMVVFKDGLSSGDVVDITYHYGPTMFYEGFQRLESELPRMSMILNGASSRFISIGEENGTQKIWVANYQIEVRSSYASQLKNLLNELANLLDNLRQNTPQLYKTIIINDIRYVNYDFDNMLRLYRGRVYFTVEWITNFK